MYVCMYVVFHFFHLYSTISTPKLHWKKRVLGVKPKRQLIALVFTNVCSHRPRFPFLPVTTSPVSCTSVLVFLLMIQGQFMQVFPHASGSLMELLFHWPVKALPVVSRLKTHGNRICHEQYWAMIQFH